VTKEGINMNAPLTMVWVVGALLPVAAMTAYWFHPQWRAMLTALLLIFQTPFAYVMDSLGPAVRSLASWLREWTGDLRQNVGYLIGALLYSVAFAVFVCSEYWLIVLTMAALGFGNGEVASRYSPDLLTAAALLGASVFWGLVLFDLCGATRLAPWERLGQAGQRGLRVASLACLGLSILTGVLLGVHRVQLAQQVERMGELPAVPSDPVAAIARVTPDGSPVPVANQPSPEAAAADSGAHRAGSSGWIPAVAVGAIAGLVGVSAAVSGLGVTLLFYYPLALLAGLILVILSLPLGVLTLAVRLFDRIYAAADALLTLAAEMGRGLLNALAKGNRPPVEQNPPPPAGGGQPAPEPPRESPAAGGPSQVPPATQPIPQSVPVRAEGGEMAWDPFGVANLDEVF